MLLVLLAAVSTDVEVGASSPQSVTKGVQQLRAILVEFSDMKHTVAYQTIRDRLRELDDYYREVSYGQAWVAYDVTEKWYEVVSPLGRLDIQKWDYEQGDMTRLRREVIAAADKDVDFRNYEYVLIIAAGRVWSNAGSGYSIPTDDGVNRLNIATVNERSLSGTYAHELGHLVPSDFARWNGRGLPDLYSYEASKRGEPSAVFVGPWDLMDVDNPPRHFSSFSKILLGWMKPEAIRPSSTEVVLFIIEPITKDSGTRAVKIPIKSTTYYLVEVRRRAGFDRALPDEGVILYYVDETKTSGYGIVRAVDKNPLTKTLNDAAFHVGDRFEDDENGIYIVVAMTDDSSFTVAISGSRILSLKDTDGDGLFDYIEEKLGTNLKNPDTDGDGLSDGEEVNKHRTNPLKADTDGDGLSDVDEIKKYRTNPLEPDTDRDGLSDGLEVKIGSDPLKVDTDADGLTDGEEVNKYGTNPLKVDTDGDELTDREELLKGTNPLKIDTDGDLWNDRVDPDPANPLMPNLPLLVAAVVIILIFIVLRKRRSSQTLTQNSTYAIASAQSQIDRLESVSVKYCSGCGRGLRLDVKYCPKCGAKQDYSGQSL
jgi:M6 family metalloprotease-like protein